MNLRPESPADAPAITALMAAAFRDHPFSRQTEGRIVEALRARGRIAQSAVAERDGQLLGYACVSPVRLVPAAPGWFGLGPVAVLPGHQRSGIGSRLITHLLEALKAQGAAGCVVLGDPAYYGRFGFRASPALTLPGVPPEVFQAVSVAGRPLPIATVSYDTAFDTP